MTIVDRGSWGKVPWDLACHCQNCDLVSAAPDGRCVECGSEAVYSLKREEPAKSDPPPVRRVEVHVEISGDDFDYVRYVLGLLSLEAEEHNAGSFQKFSGGGGGSYAVTTVTRDVSREAFRAELMAWHGRQLAKSAQVKMPGGEPVLLPAGAVMGAEMIAPEQRNARGDDVQ